MEPALNTPLKARLEQELEAKAFIGRDELQTICTPKEIRQFLDEDEVLSKQVWDKAPKLFALLVLLDHAEVLREILAKSCFDDHFFGITEERPYCQGGILDAFPELDTIRDDFLEKQWLIPPILSKVTHQKFPASFFDDHFIKYGKCEEIAGTGRRVHKVRIPGRLIEDYPEPFLAVCKKNTSDYDKPWHKVLNEVKIMRSRKHSNVISLLASFEVTETFRENRLYMLLEYAIGGNMHDWMRLKQTPVLLKNNPGGQRSHLYEVVKSLAFALSFLHRQTDDSLLCHFDLKPANILLFQNDQGNTWKIADFGNSERIYLPNGTKCRLDHGTPAYAPPEFFLSRGEERDRYARHGQEYDVWSMGCIFLELATLIGYGWEDNEEIIAFERRRRSKRHDASFLATDVVSRQVAALRSIGTQETDEQIRLNHLLELTQNMMEKDRDNRARSFEIALQAYDLLSSKDKEHDLPSRQRTIAKLVEEPITGNDLSHNPLTRAEDRQDHFLAKALRAAGWGNEDRWQSYQDWPFASNPHSNLSTRFGKNTIIGRDRILGNITRDFDAPYNRGTKRRICLYGLGGAGKSHVAFDYAAACRDRDLIGSNQSRPRLKHTFWIEAGDRSKLINHCDVICKMLWSADKSKIYPFQGQMDRLRTWLDDAENDPWLIVLDGLDKVDIAEIAAQKLNAHDRGQIIITTRNKEVSRYFDVDDDAAFEVTELKPEYARRLFRTASNLPRRSDNPSDTSIDTLLAMELRLPLLIKHTATYVNSVTKLGASVESIVEDIKTRKKQFTSCHDVEDRIQAEHLIFCSTIKDFIADKPDQDFDIQLLLLSACFSSVEFELLVHWADHRVRSDGRLHETGHTKLRTALCRYCDRSLITEKAQGWSATHETTSGFTMHGTIRRSVLIYFEKTKGHSFVLSAFDVMLQTLLLGYHRSWRAAVEAQRGTKLRKTDKLKVQFMPHFERFLEYAKDIEISSRGNLPKFGFSPAAIQSILSFAHHLACQKRSDEAIRLLKFAQRQGIEESTETSRRKGLEVDILLELASLHRQRCNGLSSEPHLSDWWDDADEACYKATKLGLIPKIWPAMQENWRALLSQQELEQASQNIELMKEFLRNHPEKHPDDEDRRSIRLQELRAELIFWKGYSIGDKDVIAKSRKAWVEVIRIVADMPGESQWLENVIVKLACVNMEIPCESALLEAERIFSASLRGLRGKYEYSPVNPVFWTTRWLLALCKLRLKRSEEAERWLRELLDAVQKQRSVDQGFRRRVARSLRDALHYNEKIRERDELVRLHGISSVREDDFRLGRCFPLAGNELDQHWEGLAPIGDGLFDVFNEDD